MIRELIRLEKRLAAKGIAHAKESKRADNSVTQAMLHHRMIYERNIYIKKLAKTEPLKAKMLRLQLQYRNKEEKTELSKLIIKTLGENGAGGSYTLADIGRVLGVSRERARQLQDTAIKKINHPYSRRILKEEHPIESEQQWF